MIEQNQGLRAWIKSIPGPGDTPNWSRFSHFAVGRSFLSNLIFGAVQLLFYWAASFITSSFRYFKDMRTEKGFLKSALGGTGWLFFGTLNLLLAQPVNLIGYVVRTVQSKVDNLFNIFNKKISLERRMSLFIPIKLQRHFEWFQPPTTYSEIEPPKTYAPPQQLYALSKLLNFKPKTLNPSPAPPISKIEDKSNVDVYARPSHSKPPYEGPKHNNRVKLKR